MSLVRVTTPRIKSDDVSRRTLKRRSNEINTVRDLISKGSSLEQLQYEVKTLPMDEREALLDQAMVKEASITIPDEDILALKADLSFPWNKLRELKRY